ETVTRSQFPRPAVAGQLTVTRSQFPRVAATQPPEIKSGRGVDIAASAKSVQNIKTRASKVAAESATAGVDVVSLRRVARALAARRCPRVHMKVVVIDGELLYLGSANWTGAGLGAKGSGRRNFELGIVTSDAPMLDAVQSLYERVWSGGECGSCKLQAVCPG